MRSATSRFLGIVSGLALLTAVASATHCVPTTPSSMTQQNGDSSPLATGGVTSGGTPTSVILSGTITASCDQGQTVQCEYEVVPTASSYSGSPTHIGNTTNVGGVSSVTVTGLTPGVAYKWQVRENDVTYGAIGSYTDFNGGATAFTVGGGGPPPPPPPPGSGGRLFAVSGARGAASTLYELNPMTAAVAATIGSVGFPHTTALSFNATTGELLAHENNGRRLLRLDLTTGAGTVIGSTGHQIPDMDFDPTSGTLYGWSEFGPGASDDLIRINPTTGAVTVIGSPLGSAAIGVTVDASGQLWAKVSTSLSRIDKTTGAVQSTTGLSGSGGLQNMLTMDPTGTTMYSGAREGPGFVLKTINTGASTFTTVGSNSLTNISAIAFEPASAQLPGVGFGGKLAILVGLAAMMMVFGRAKAA